MTIDLHEAIATDIRGWDGIDDHRTGTRGDRQTAQWLAENVRAAGLEPHQDAFALRRWVLRDCAVAVNGRRAAGVPLFDGGTTEATGVTAPLAPLPGAGSGIGFASVGGAAGASANQAFAAARRSNGRPALVAVTKGHPDVPGLALQNADRFNAPFGPPAVQVASEHDVWLREAAAAGETATVTAHVEFETAQGWNVRARVAGRDPALAPLVVMTPKSAWWVCTAERGGGIALLLALVRRFAAQPPARDVLFVATSGHELGHLGLDSFLGDNPGLGAGAHAWIHLGANFATRGGGTRVQASETALLGLARAAMEDAECPPDRVTPLGERPGGEARNIHDLGGRYVSYLGTNPWFHHPDDRWPTTVDVHKTARLATAMFEVADRLAAP
ncbi:MAG: hypothetical protein OXH15_10785 [Gammaproteobacteria bacterium]|nr:hypothetical protein [Gammaproteobacteria bacterium]